VADNEVFILDALPSDCPECQRRRSLRAFVSFNPLGTVTTTCPACGSSGGGEDVPGGPDMIEAKYVERKLRFA